MLYLQFTVVKWTEKKSLCIMGSAEAAAHNTQSLQYLIRIPTIRLNMEENGGNINTGVKKTQHLSN